MVNGATRTFRNEVNAENAPRRQSPAARVDLNPNAHTASRVSGPATAAPVELTEIDYILGEAEVLKAVRRSPTPLGRAPPSMDVPRWGEFLAGIPLGPNDQKLPDPRSVYGDMGNDRVLDCLNSHSVSPFDVHSPPFRA